MQFYKCTQQIAINIGTSCNQDFAAGPSVYNTVDIELQSSNDLSSVNFRNKAEILCSHEDTLVKDANLSHIYLICQLSCNLSCMALGCEHTSHWRMVGPCAWSLFRFYCRLHILMDTAHFASCIFSEMGGGVSYFLPSLISCATTLTAAGKKRVP